jgi:protein tyrosine phosphatase (PTP) superfamily phosphohydrolase (DUF442 family)
LLEDDELAAETTKPRPRIRRRILLATLALIALGWLGWGLYYGHWVFFEHRFATITEGQVYKSGSMPKDDLLESVEEHGVRAVIDLRMHFPDEVAREAESLRKVGVKHFHLPTDQVPEDETVDAFLEIMKDRANRPVLIHCRDGEGRAVLFSAIYRVEFEGWGTERARRATRILSWRGGFKPGSDKGEYLRAYVPRLNGSD